MNEILSLLGWVVMALVLVAVIVAGWEHLVREAHGRRVGSSAHAKTKSRATVDVPLDTASAALLPEPEAMPHPPKAPAPAPGAITGAGAITEHAARLAAMTQALARAANPGRAAQDAGRWMETTPGVVGLNQPVLRDRDAHGRELLRKHSHGQSHEQSHGQSGEHSSARAGQSGPGQPGRKA